MSPLPRLGLVRLAGVEDDVPDPARQSLHLSSYLLAGPVLGDPVDPEPPVVHRLGHHQVPRWPHLEVVQSLHRVLRILSEPVQSVDPSLPLSHLSVGELDVGVTSVEAVVVHHQPHLVDLTSPGEHGQQLLLEAVSGDPCDINLAA